MILSIFAGDRHKIIFWSGSNCLFL